MNANISSDKNTQAFAGLYAGTIPAAAFFLNVRGDICSNAAACCTFNVCAPLIMEISNRSIKGAKCIGGI
jgi:hypothetical protein